MASDDEKKLGKYLLRSRLGQGGMGIVYLATDTRLQREVAIKVLPKTMSSNADAVKRFLREARVAARLNHPNVVAVHDVDQQRGLCYLVMELIKGQTAAELIARESLPWPEATRLIAEACRGLVAAHAAGLVHRDIKPSNIMRTNDGLVKLTDFGLAKMADDSQSAREPLTQSGAILGTPQYMSPEQCRGEPTDARSDLYSLGATYFTLLTRQTPYLDSQPMQIMFAHCSKPVPDPRSVRSDLPVECSAIVMRAMSKSRADRFGSANEMLVALTNLLTNASVGEPVATLPSGVLPPGDLPSQKTTASYVATNDSMTAELAQASVRPNQETVVELRNNAVTQRIGKLSEQFGAYWKRGVMLAAGCAVVLVGLMLWKNREHSPRLSNPAEQQDYVLEPGADTKPVRPLSLSRDETLKFVREWPDVEAVRCIAFAHDGKSLFTGTSNGRLLRWNFDKDMIGDTMLKSPGSVDAIAANSRWLVAGGADKDLWLWDFTSRQGAKKLATLPHSILSIALSPDGQRLAVGTENHVELYEIRDDGVRHLSRIGEAHNHVLSCYMVYGLRFSHDSRWLAATSWDKTVGIWNARTGELQTSRRDLAHQLMSVAFVPGQDRVVLGASDQEGLFVWDWQQPDSRVRSLEKSVGRSHRSLLVSRQGIVLANGEWDGPIQRYDLEHGDLLPAIKRSTSFAAYALAASPDGQLVATGGGHHQDSRGFLHLWNVVPNKTK